MGFERNYQVKVLSKQLNVNKYFYRPLRAGFILFMFYFYLFLKINKKFKRNKKVKANDFSDWCSAHKLMNDNLHCTVEGLDLINKIRSGMNNGRNINNF